MLLSARSNQARGIARYALEFVDRAVSACNSNNNRSTPASQEFVSEDALRRASLFHADAVLCGLSALALRTRAPTVLRDEALSYSVCGNTHSGTAAPLGSARVFGSKAWVPAEKAVLANCAAVREWDSNGTVFGYHDSSPTRQAGEFGHNDYYAAVVAAVAQRIHCGATEVAAGCVALHGMVLLDELRGRLCEAFGLKEHGIDHVLHGAIATAATYGALLGATEDQIESAIGLVVAHNVPWRAIRAGEQLSDSKGSSAAFAAESAVLAVHRSMRGFVGPADVFRNPDSFFMRAHQMHGTGHAVGGGGSSVESPFDLELCCLDSGGDGDNWAVSGMHFKLGVYEHQSAGALHGLVALLCEHSWLLQCCHIDEILIRAYEPAFSIIGKETKRTPTTRQSADHSMVFIIAAALAKAMRCGPSSSSLSSCMTMEEAWARWMLLPTDFATDKLLDISTRALMEKVRFEHGGDAFDEHYPDGLPTQVIVTARRDANSPPVVLDSGLVLHPAGHARCDASTFGSDAVLEQKMAAMARLATGGDAALALAACGGSDSGAWAALDDASETRAAALLQALDYTTFCAMDRAGLHGCYSDLEIEYADGFDDSGISPADW